MTIEERFSTHVYHQKRMLTKEELNARESLCVHEQPAYCSAACPLKLDTKGMIAAISAGNFSKALTLYEKITPFPDLLSEGCEAPCEKKCKLCALKDTDGIAIQKLEQVVTLFGKKSQGRKLPRTPKRQKTAIFGSGLFSLFLAGELAKKAYPVTVFCKEGTLFDFLSKETAFASNQAIQNTLLLLENMNIAFCFSADIDHFEDYRPDFDIICTQYELATKIYSDLAFNSDISKDIKEDSNSNNDSDSDSDEECNRNNVSDEVCSRNNASNEVYNKESTRKRREKINYNSHTVYDYTHNLVTGKTTGVLDAAYTAKRAALTVDRLAQHLDPSNTRGEEGAYETSLYTDTSDVSASSSYLSGCRRQDSITEELAVMEAQRCLQCQCDACIKGCAYLQHYKKFPRILTREIYNNVSIIMGDHMMNKPINACSLCGQCAFTCPNGYDMGEICQLARENMVSTGKMPLAPHEFALMDMLFSNNEAFLSRKQPGHDTCRYVFFPGCQACAIAPDTVYAAYQDLCLRLEGGVSLMLGCCGAIADWAGRYEMKNKTAAYLDLEFEKLGNPTVIAGCPSCMKELTSHRDLTLVGIWDILSEIGLPSTAHGPSCPVALHDSCGARGNHQIQQTIRQLAVKLGCNLVETPYSGDLSPCCGYGGLTSYANREVAHKMSEKCLERSDQPYLTYCMACRDRFSREGRKSMHLLELVYGTDAGLPPDISEKRYNRLNLKYRLMSEFWKEEIPEMKCEFQVIYTDEALKMMDERMILKSDVIQVLSRLRETQEAIYDSKTGLSITRTRIGNVTFWVKYTESPDGYLVHSAYSHRMNITERR